MLPHLRLVNVPTTKGFVAEWLTDEQRSVVSQLLHAKDHYRDTGQPERLKDMEGIKVGFHTLETDPEKIEALFGDDDDDYEFYLDKDEADG